MAGETPAPLLPARARRAAHGRLALWLGALLWAAANAPAQDFVATNTLRKDFWDVAGTINAVLATHNTVYVGGDFSYVAPKGRKVASVDVFTGETLSDFPPVLGSAINAITEDGNGGWFIGGNFTKVGGLPRTNLVHMLSDNTVDTNFHPDPNDTVDALARDGDRLYVGGDFTAIGGQARSHIAALDVASGLVSPWAPEADDTVFALLVSGGTVYVGGHFVQHIGGQPRRKIAALDTATGNASGWNPQADGDVHAMGLVEDRLFVGGFFNSIGGALRSGLAALDVNSGIATSWAPATNGQKVTALKVDCNTAYVGGYFTNIAGANRNRVAAIDTQSGLALPWDAKLGLLNDGNSASHILALEVVGNTVYLGGQFSSVDGQARRDLVAVDATSGQLLAWNPGLNGDVSALAVAGRTLLAGSLASPGGVERRNLAAFDALTGRVTDWSPDADGAVSALALSGNMIFAGGSFTNVGGQPRQRIAAIDADSGALVAGWNPGASSDVLALVAANGTLYAGGRFTFLGGLLRRHMAALDANTGQLLTNWTASPDLTVNALALAGGTLYVGGNFGSIGTSNRHHLAALSAATGQVLPWNPDVSDPVHALVASGNLVYAGGEFTSVGGTDRGFLAAIDANGLPTSWSPDADNPVYALAVSGNTIYAGGIFRDLGGQPREGVAAINADGTLLEWNPGVPDANRVFALALSENTLFVAGSGLQFDSSPSILSLAAFPRVGAPIILQPPADQSALSGGDATFTVEAGGQAPLFYQWWFNEVNLPGETNSTLLLTTVQLAQSGSYRVVVSNALGAVTAEAAFKVLEPVAITVQPASQTVGATNSVTLSVSATGSPPLLYQWRLNGVNIPGAVFPTLTLSNVGPASGGSYYAAIANSVGAVNSDIATILVTSQALPFDDKFGSRGTINGASGTGSGSNVDASVQTAEPVHAGKPGGKSVWLSWVAPADGIATFSTRGSSFDTLLAIYSGPKLTNLTAEASDDDRGGFVTSQASFNATNGVEYQIAVDGLAGASGNIVLSWELEAGAEPFPKITAQPLSQTVEPGGNATFVVTAFSPTPMQFQWFFGCREIPGATTDTLTITNVQARQAGSYRVVIVNDSSRLAESLPAALEIGPNPRVRSFEKIEDLFEALSGSTNGFRAASPKSASGLGGEAMLVSMGSIVSQLFNTSPNNPGLRVINECGVIGGHPAWLAFKPAADGKVLVDTIGSTFDTILSIYRSTNDLHTLQTNLGSLFVKCDNNSAPDGVRSLLRFDATAGTVYLAVVDGAGGASGPAQIHWGLGLAPVIVSGGSNFTSRFGSSVTLEAGVANGNPAPTYQWRLNGTNLLGMTGAHLVLNNLRPDQAGTYSVIASNLADIITNVCATLTVDVPLHLESMAWLANRQFACQVMGNAGQFYALQASTNLMDWVTLMTNQLASGHSTFTDPNATRFKQRFYRAMPWVQLSFQLVKTNGQLASRLHGFSGQGLVLETSADLLHWLPLHTNAAPNVSLDYLDLAPTNQPRRFYRSRLEP